MAGARRRTKKRGKVTETMGAVNHTSVIVYEYFKWLEGLAQPHVCLTVAAEQLQAASMDLILKEFLDLN